MLRRTVAARLKPPIPRSLKNTLPNAKHQDIPSFLAYAEEVGLSPKSSVYRGTLYEYTVREALFTKNMHLLRCGGPGDKGIDLRGTWHIPLPTPLTSKSTTTTTSNAGGLNSPSIQSSLTPLHTLPTHPIPVLVQCKLSLKTAPCIIRELNGTHNSTPTTIPPTIAILSTPTPTTRGITSALNMAKRPLAYLCISDRGTVRQFVWNTIASEVIGTGMGVSLLHSPSPVDVDDEGQEGGVVGGDTENDADADSEAPPHFPNKEIVLTFNGRVVDGILAAIKAETKRLDIFRLEAEKAHKKQLRLEKKLRELTLPEEERLAMEARAEERRIVRVRRKEEKQRLLDLEAEMARKKEEARDARRRRREEKVRAAQEAVAAEERRREERRVSRRMKREEKLRREAAGGGVAAAAAEVAIA